MAWAAADPAHARSSANAAPTALIILFMASSLSCGEIETASRYDAPDPAGSMTQIKLPASDLTGGDLVVMVGMREQSRNGLLDAGAVVQDLVHRLRDRHVHIMAASERRDRLGGMDALLDRHPLAQDIREFSALAERNAERGIARFRAVAAQVEVARSREPHERLHPRAHRDAQARHLGESARKQRCARALAQLPPHCRAAGDGDDVLQRSTDEGTDDVVRDIGAEARCPDRPREPFTDFAVGAGESHADRAVHCDVVREGRAGQDRYRRARKRFGDDLRHQGTASALDALRARNHRHPSAETGAQLTRDGAHVLRRRSEEEEVGLFDGRSKIVGGPYARHEGNARKEYRVHRVAIDRSRDLGFARPDNGLVPRTPHHARHRRPEGPSSNHPDPCHACYSSAQFFERSTARHHFPINSCARARSIRGSKRRSTCHCAASSSELFQ